MNQPEKCRCLPPAVFIDKEICEAIEGMCIPELGSTLPQVPPTSIEVGPGCPPATPYRTGPNAECDPVQRFMQIPFELCPDFERWQENRYVWEE